MIELHLNTFSDLQKRYLLKDLISAITQVLMVAILTNEIVSNFSVDIILLKNYLMGSPMLLILIPAIKRLIRDNPVLCYRLKGMLSISGLVMLVCVEIFDLSKIWYLVDAGMMSVVGLLMMTHKGYYKASVNNKCKLFSETCGYIEMFSTIVFVLLGVLIVQFDIPTLSMLLIVLPMEITERCLENSCVDEVYNEGT